MAYSASTSQLPEFDLLWDFDHPDETERKFRDLLPLAKQHADSAYEIELLTQIARTLGLQQKFEDAQRILDEAGSKLKPAMQRPRLRWLLERGRVLNSSSQPEAARPIFVEAWELGKAAHEDFYAVDAAHMVAITEKGQAVLDWNLQAVALAEKSGQPKVRKWLGSLYNNIGWTYHDMGQYETALAIFEKALEFRTSEGKAEPTRIAKWCIARTLRSMGRVEEALGTQRALLLEYDALGEKPGYTYEELGECLLALGQKEEARPYFRLAHEALREDLFLARDEPDRLNRLRELGEG